MRLRRLLDVLFLSQLHARTHAHSLAHAHALKALAGLGLFVVLFACCCLAVLTFSSLVSLGSLSIVYSAAPIETEVVFVVVVTPLIAQPQEE